MPSQASRDLRGSSVECRNPGRGIGDQHDGASPPGSARARHSPTRGRDTLCTTPQTSHSTTSQAAASEAKWLMNWDGTGPWLTICAPQLDAAASWVPRTARGLGSGVAGRGSRPHRSLAGA